jgi:hypothetical protein
VTGTSGAFTLGGVASTASGLTASLSNYVTGIWPLSPTSSLSAWGGALYPTTSMAALATKANQTFSPTGPTGVVGFTIYDGPVSTVTGATVTTSAISTVVYFDADGATPDPSLKSTSSAGTGLIFGLSGSQTDLTFTSPGHTCTRGSSTGWVPVNASATMSVPIQDGAITVASANCQ